MTATFGALVVCEKQATVGRGTKPLLCGSSHVQAWIVYFIEKAPTIPASSQPEVDESVVSEECFMEPATVDRRRGGQRGEKVPSADVMCQVD